VHEAVNGRDAVRRFAELRPDVTTMDISMPVTDGLTATREILLLDHAARVVVVTAQDEGPGEAEALAAGAVGYLAKPFQPVELLATLDGVVPSAPEDG
jgi:two-component system chemotaxis response regulator CheY